MNYFKNIPSNGNIPDSVGQKSSSTAHEYAEAIRVWMLQNHWSAQMNWYLNTTMPLMSMNCAMLNAVAAGQSAALPPYSGPQPYNLANTTTVPPSDTRNNTGTQQNVQTENRQLGLQEWKIPPIWRRVVAEFIDFFLLFVMKLAFSLMLMDYVDLQIIDFDKYDLQSILNDWDSDAALAFTSEIIALEFINRIVACLFEAACMWKGPGGATPGKRMMRLQVIACSLVLPTSTDRVVIIPAGNLNFISALVRSVLKNFSAAFLFPLCFTALLTPYMRASYDMISGSIVVESQAFTPQPRAE